MTPFKGGDWDEELVMGQIEKIIKNILKRCEELEIESVCFLPMGTGFGGIPIELFAISFA